MAGRQKKLAAHAFALRALLLAVGAEGAGAAADGAFAEKPAADRARLSGLAVNLKIRRIAVIFPFCLQIFFRREPVFFDKVGEALRDENGQPLPVLFFQAAGRAAGGDAGRKRISSE